MLLQLITNGGGTTAAPSLVTDGFLCRKIGGAGPDRKGMADLTRLASLCIEAGVTAATAGTVSARLWGLFGENQAGGVWNPLDISVGGTQITAAADLGKVNLGVAVGEYDAAADKIRFHQNIRFPSDAIRMYCEVTAVANLVAASLQVKIWARD